MARLIPADWKNTAAAKQEKAPPPPCFGVDANSEPTVAHMFSLDSDWKSACGVPCRLMRSEDETHLVTCPTCAEIAVYWSKGERPPTPPTS